MNLGRFHAAISQFAVAAANEDWIEKLEQVLSALSNVVASPGSPATEAFRSSIDALERALEASSLNAVSATQLKIYDELDARSRYGAGLWNRVKQVLSENNLAPSLAVTELKEIVSDVKRYAGKITSIDDNFTGLVKDFDQVRPGEYEIGFSIPRSITTDRLDRLQKELGEIDFCVRTFQEIATGDGGSPVVRTISASDWQIYMSEAPKAAACIAVAIERIVALYKSGLEIRALKRQLDDKNLPPAVTQPLADHLENSLKTELKRIGEEIVDEFHEGDIGRRNELKNKVPRALRFLADRLDRGAIVEVNTKLPERPEGSDATPLNADAQAAYDAALFAATQVLERMDLVSKLRSSESIGVRLLEDEQNESSQ